MADQSLLDKIRTLADVELACLLSLATKEHCIISTTPDALEALIAKLNDVAHKTLGLTPAVIDCGPSLTPDEFTASLFVSQYSHSHGDHLTPHIVPPGRRGSPILSRSTNSGREDGFAIPRRSSAVSVASNSIYQTGHARRSSAVSISSGNHYPSALPSTGRQLPQSYSHHNLHPLHSNRVASSPITPAFNSSSSAASRIANVILAVNLNLAPKDVQIQALELIRTRRIFTHTAVHAAPKQFLVIAVLSAESGGKARLTPHLNDFFQLAHWTEPEDVVEPQKTEGLGVGVGESVGDIHSGHEPHRPLGPPSDDSSSESDDVSFQSSRSVVRRSSYVSRAHSVATTNRRPNSAAAVRKGKQPEGIEQFKSFAMGPIISETEIVQLAEMSKRVKVDVEVLRYQMNLVVFMRLHRAVRPGCLSPKATQFFRGLTLCLASLHGMDFVTPSLVELAVRKVYLHRVEIVAPARERSMQWGSDLAAVKSLLEGVGPEDVIEDVLGSVALPV